MGVWRFFCVNSPVARSLSAEQHALGGTVAEGVLQCIGVTPGAAPAATLGEHARRWRTPIATAQDKTLLERGTAALGLYHALLHLCA